jgi:flagellar motor switch protein FliM
VLDKFFSGADQQRVKRMTGSELERKETRAIAEASLRVTQVDVVARLPDFHIPMHALLELSVGSVLSTPISVDASLEVHIPGMNRYLAESGRVGRKLAVRIIDPPSAVAPPPATLVS